MSSGFSGWEILPKHIGWKTSKEDTSQLQPWPFHAISTCMNISTHAYHTGEHSYTSHTHTINEWTNQRNKPSFCLFLGTVRFKCLGLPPPCFPILFDSLGSRVMQWLRVQCRSGFLREGRTGKSRGRTSAKEFELDLVSVQGLNRAEMWWNHWLKTRAGSRADPRKNPLTSEQGVGGGA